MRGNTFTNAMADAAALRAAPTEGMPGAASFHAAPTEGIYPTDVWAAVDTWHKCKIIDVPDIPARPFADREGLVHMIVGSTSFHPMNGSSPLNVSRSCAVAWNQTHDADPSRFAGDEFLDSPIVFPNGTIVSLVHTEYPGNVYNHSGPGAPHCGAKAYPLCWTVTVGLAVSHDWGKTWAHALPPPRHLAFAVPYTYNMSHLAYGWGDPSNIVKGQHHHAGRHLEEEEFYYVAVWNRNQIGLQAPGICMARSNHLLDPGSWRGWGGSSFNVSFVSPYTMTPGSEAQHICQVTNLPLGCAPAGLAWSNYLSLYVVTLGCGRDGFKMATSSDLIVWSDTRPLPSLPTHTNVSNVSKMVRAQNYPTFIDPSAPTAFADPNYYTIGKAPYLFWVSIGDSPYHYGRHLWATPYTFEKTNGGTVL